MHSKNLKNILQIREQLLHFLNEDIGYGDITSEYTIPTDASVKSEIICKSDILVTVCGLEEIEQLFILCDPTLRISKLVTDGSHINKGTTVMTIEGNAHAILKSERTALNLLMRMSGIATETRRFVDKVNHYGHIKIASTRKTAPGLRLFDKKAVVMGGGVSHRLRLDEMVMIKDNHIAITGSVSNAISEVRKQFKSTIECEVKSFDEAVEAISQKPEIILLDNFSPDEVSKTLGFMEKNGIRNNFTIEISGGVNLDNIDNYAKLKPDVISLGYLTHSSKSIDFSLEIYPL